MRIFSKKEIDEFKTRSSDDFPFSVPGSRAAELLESVSPEDLLQRILTFAREEISWMIDDIEEDHDLDPGLAEDDPQEMLYATYCFVRHWFNKELIDPAIRHYKDWNWRDVREFCNFDVDPALLHVLAKEIIKQFNIPVEAPKPKQEEESKAVSLFLEQGTKPQQLSLF